MVELANTVAAVRRFSRFYTRAVGALDRRFLGGPYTLAETRVLYEIANGGDDVTPGAVAEALDLDAGYLSRMLARLEKDGLVARRRSARDGRSFHLALTSAGQTHFAQVNVRTAAQVETLVAGLGAEDQGELVATLDRAETLLGGHGEKRPVVLRPHAAGDMGWITERHGVLYGREYGWGLHIEAVTARICADFLDNFDPERERCWIAERGGVRLGCVFLVKESDEVARLRLLLLEPAARGEGLGRRLVDECVAFARQAGYREIVLWTHQVLTAARAIYAAVGFEITEVWEHDEFGKTEVSETWRLKL